MNIERNVPNRELWTATGFCVALSAITVIGMLVSYAIGGGQDPSVLLVFLCNLPLAFMLAAFPLKRANERIEALENRLLELEAARVASGG